MENKEQEDSQVVDLTCKTSMEKLKSYSTRDLLDAYELEFWFEERPWDLH